MINISPANKQAHAHKKEREREKEVVKQKLTLYFFKNIFVSSHFNNSFLLNDHSNKRRQ